MKDEEEIFRQDNPDGSGLRSRIYRIIFKQKITPAVPFLVGGMGPV
jgi:hypothetical protein